MAETNLSPAAMSDRTKAIVAVGLVTGNFFLVRDNGLVETVTKPMPVLAVLGLESGIPFHVKVAKEQGASREDQKMVAIDDTWRRVCLRDCVETR